MSYRQLQGWRAYFQLDPFGYERSDLHTGLIVQALVNAFRDPESDPVELEDCLPRFGESQLTQAKRRKRKRKEVREKLQNKLRDL